MTFSYLQHKKDLIIFGFFVVFNESFKIFVKSQTFF